MVGDDNELIVSNNMLTDKRDKFRKKDNSVN